MRAVVFDLPGVIEETRSRLAEAGLTGRCEAIAGDFFEAVPAGGDAYVLSWILHDWDDRSAVRILANCRAAMRGGGRLLAIEMVVPTGDEPRSSPDLDRLVKTTDLEMLAIVGGRERTAAEYRELYASGGFELTRILPLDSLPGVFSKACNLRSSGVLCLSRAYGPTIGSTSSTQPVARRASPAAVRRRPAPRLMTRAT
jgi:hypothetical protein